MKLYAYLAAALILAGAFAYGVHIYKKAERAEAAEKALTDYKGAVAAREKKEADDRKAAEARSKTLATTLDQVSATLDDLRAHPPKASVIREKLPGDDCPRLRLSDDFVRVWNAAADASAVPFTH